MTDAEQGTTADRQELGRLTVLAFAAVSLLGGINGIAAKQILRELTPLWSGTMRFAIRGADHAGHRDGDPTGAAARAQPSWSDGLWRPGFRSDPRASSPGCAIRRSAPRPSSWL